MAIRHEVTQGECVFSIAFDYGYFPDTIWDHADNSDLRSKRQDPAELLPGDVLTIPDKRIVESQLATNKRYRFRRKGVPKVLKIRLLRGEKPMANERVTIVVDEGATQTRTTDAEGWLVCPIAPNAKTAVLRMKGGAEYRLQLGQMDPLSTVSGLQGRLTALGFYSGPIDGAQSDALTQAIQEFQASVRLPVSGEADADTRSKLEKLTSS